MNRSRLAGFALIAATAVFAAGCAVVPSPDGPVVVPAPVTVSPPAVVVNPWWGYGYWGGGPRYYDYGPRYYGGPRYSGRPTPPPPRYWGPGAGPSFPPPMR